MAQKQILVEGIANIDNNLETAAEQLNSFLGKQKYAFSYSAVSGNAEVKAVLDAIVNRVEFWPSVMRNNNYIDFRRKEIVLVACVIPQLATRLYEFAKKFLHKDFGEAINWFKQLNDKLNNDVAENEYASVGDRFYAACIDSVKYMTQTRPGTELAEDMSASDTYSNAIGKLANVYRPFRQLVIDILSAVKLDGQVHDSSIDAATKFIVANDCITNYVYGAEWDKKSWYDKNQAAAVKLYIYVTKQGAKKGAFKEASLSDEVSAILGQTDADEELADADDVTDYANRMKKAEKEKLRKAEAGKAARLIDKKLAKEDGASPVQDDQSNVVDNMMAKDMDTIGDNTTQLNYVSNDTKFTGKLYYPVFAVDGLTQYSGTELGKRIQRLCVWLFNNIGITGLSALMPYDNFARIVNEFFKTVSDDTDKAIHVHADLCDMYQDAYDSDKDGLYALVIGCDADELTEDSKKDASDAIDAFFGNVVYMGTDRMSGQTLGGGKIVGKYMRQGVPSFGESNRSARNVTLGLTTPGKEMSALFKFDDDELSVGYSSEESGSSKDVDTIPLDMIRDVHDSYVSSSLMPVRISRKSLSWVVVKGIVAYAEYKNGTMSDSVQPNEFIKSVLPMYRGVHQDTRASVSSQLINEVSEPTFSKRLTEFGFVGPDAAENVTGKIDLGKSVYAKYKDEDLDDALRDVITVCDTLTQAISAYATAVENSSVYIKKSVARDRVNKVLPDMNEFVTMFGGNVGSEQDDFIRGSSDAIDEFIVQYVKSLPADGDTEYMANSSGNIVRTLPKEAMADYVASYDALNNAKGGFGLMNALVQYVMKAKRMSESNSELVPDNFPELYTAVISIYEKAVRLAQQSGDSKAMKAALKSVADENVKQMASIRDALTKPGVDRIIGEMREHIEEDPNELGDLVSHVSGVYADLVTDDNLKVLRRGLVDTAVAINKEELTPEKLAYIETAIANTMSGSKKVNLDKLTKEKPNQIVIPAKTMQRLYNIGQKAEFDVGNIDTAADLSNIEFPENSVDPVGELDPFASENAKNRALNEISSAEDSIVTGASTSTKMLDESHDVLDTVIDMFNKYKFSADHREQVVAKLRKIYEFANDEMDNALVDNKMPVTKRAWTTAAKRSGKVSQSFINAALRLIDLVEGLDDQTESVKEEWETMKNAYPSFSGLITAIEEGKVDPDDINAVFGTVDAAASVLNELVKYSDGDTSGRLYAYTENDMTAVSQVVYIVGSHLCMPNNDTKEDLVDVLTNVRNIIERFSGNPLSVKFADFAVKTIANTNDDVDLAIAELSIIGKASGILQANTADRNQGFVNRTGSIGLPSTAQSEDDKRPALGVGLDAYARTMLRSRDDTDTSKALGRASSSENAARKSYVDVVKDDMDRHPELAKYAYAMGNLIDAFERTVTDERVDESNRESRKYSSIKESMSEVSLEGDLGDNDLQRELLSAIMDDERKGDKSYPTVRSVVNAARTGQPVNAYGLEYGKLIGSRENIVNNVRNLSISFDEQGAGHKDGAGSPLSLDEIGRLAVGNEKVNYVFDDETDITGLVKAVRMAVCRKIAKKIGEIDDEGNVITKSGTDMAKTAVKSLYKMCADLDTPISSIMVANSNLGYKLGRDVSVAYAKKSLTDEGDLDFDTVSRVAGEPDAFPTSYSDEKSLADDEWIDQLTSILGSIPDELSENDVRRAVSLYCGTRVDKGTLASDAKLRPMYPIIDRLTRLDTDTGVPMGFWGNDQTKGNDTIRSIFNMILSSSMDGKSWTERADILRARFKKASDAGYNLLALYGEYEPKKPISKVTPSAATSKIVAHRRNNPYYALPMHNLDSREYMTAVKMLSSAGYIKQSNDNTVQLKYPGMSLDKNTFAYVVMLSITLAASGRYSVTSAFDTALMCYMTGVRLDRYNALSNNIGVDDDKSVSKVDKLLGVTHSGNSVKTPYGVYSIGTYKAMCNLASKDPAGLEAGIQKVMKSFKKVREDMDAEFYGNMVKTKYGWFTSEVFGTLCIAAVTDPAGIDGVVASITSGGKRDTDITQVTREPSSDVFKGDSDEETVQTVEEPKPEKTAKPATEPVAEPAPVTEPETEPAEETSDSDDDFVPEVHPAEQTAVQPTAPAVTPTKRRTKKSRFGNLGGLLDSLKAANS